MADHLIKTAGNHGLSLITPRGTITWRSRGLQSIIDLVFLSQRLETKLIKYTTRLDLAQSSDHIPIETTLKMGLQQVVTAHKRCWKRLDREKLLKTLENKVPDTPIQSNEQINTRVYEITRALQEAIEQSVPWARPSTRTKDYWNQECKEAVYEARQAYYDLLRERTTITETRLKELRNRKIAVIRRHQRRQFRS